jgi:uncharacterized repeat protein (TIGR01451 family)
MPTLLFKLLALSGVISAGCFAVWKANSELQPTVAANPSQFTPLEGEPAEGVGLGGQPLPTSASSLPASDEPEPVADNLLALADPAFSGEAFEAEEPTPRSMPASFPPEQDEPTLVVTPEATAAEPGVSSLEVLEASEPAARERTPGGAAANSPLPKSSALRQFPKDAGAPVLMTVPPQSAALMELPRSRTPSRIVPANDEVLVESELDLVPDADEVPAPPGELPEWPENSGIIPASDEVGTTQAGVPIPLSSGRTRGPAIPQPETVAVPDPDTELFDFSNPGPIQQPDAVEVPDPAESTPELSPFAPRSRSSLPTPVEEVVPADIETEPAPLNLAPNQRPARTPTHTHAIGEDLETAPPVRTSIPSTATPARSITPDMLIGNATVEDPLLTPTQQPQLRIEKKAQAEAEVGEKFVYEIIVQNVGSVPAQYVVVEERIPKGARMERSQPQAHIGRDRILRWELETMQPNTQKIIKVEVTPLEAGPIGSVATVRFAAQVATKTVVTAPTLSLSIKHPPEVAVGEQVPVKFVVTNSGTGSARKASLRAVLQEGLHHPAGLDLDQDLGTLAPGQSKEIDLIVTASEQGRYTPHVIVTANGIEQENRTLDLSVIESRLTLSREGHARRFVNRPAEFVTKVTNHSVETMKDVIITEQLPEGVTPVGEMGKFRWSPKDRTVSWKVSELGPGQHSDLKLSVVSARAGSLIGKVQAVAASGHRAELPTELEVQGFSSLTLDFQGDGKAVAVGDQVSMRVTVGNRGSAPAKQVQALFELPPQMTFVAAKGSDNVKATQEGNLVTFEVLEELAPNSNQTYDIVLTAAQEGTPLVGVELISTDLPKSIHQQEAVTITP